MFFFVPDECEYVGVDYPTIFDFKKFRWPHVTKAVCKCPMFFTVDQYERCSIRFEESNIASEEWIVRFDVYRFSFTGFSFDVDLDRDVYEPLPESMFVVPTVPSSRFDICDITG